MDSRTEHIPLPEPRKIRIGESFTPFDPRSTSIQRPREDDGFITRVNVKLPELSLPDFKLEISTASSARIVPNRSSAISPFNPDNGYRVSKEDADSSERIEKVAKMEKDNPAIDRSIDPLVIHIGGDEKTISVDEWFSRYDDNEAAGVLKDGFEERIRRLGLQLSFPDGKGEFESMPTELFTDPNMAGELLTNSGIIDIWQFFPRETGILSTYEREGVPGLPHLHSSGAFYMLLPNDLQRLAQIRAKFVIARDSFTRDFSKSPSGDNFVPPPKTYREPGR